MTYQDVNSTTNSLNLQKPINFFGSSLSRVGSMHPVYFFNFCKQKNIAFLPKKLKNVKQDASNTNYVSRAEKFVCHHYRSISRVVVLFTS